MSARAAFALGVVALCASCREEKSREPAPVADEKTDLELLREKTRSNPRDDDAWNHLAELYDRAGAYEEEVDALKHVVAVKPELAYAHFRMGTAYNRLARYDDAVAAFTNAAKHGQNQPMIYNNMAFSYGRLGKTDEEIAALRKAIAIRPGYATAHFNLALALMKKGKRGEAVKEQALLNELDDDLAAKLAKMLEPKSK